MTIRKTVGKVLFVGGAIALAQSIKHADKIKAAAQTVKHDFIEGFKDGYRESSQERMLKQARRQAEYEAEMLRIHNKNKQEAAEAIIVEGVATGEEQFIYVEPSA